MLRQIIALCLQPAVAAAAPAEQDPDAMLQGAIALSILAAVAADPSAQRAGTGHASQAFTCWRRPVSAELLAMVPTWAVLAQLLPDTFAAITLAFRCTWADFMPNLCCAFFFILYYRFDTTK